MPSPTSILNPVVPHLRRPRQSGKAFCSLPLGRLRALWLGMVLLCFIATGCRRAEPVTPSCAADAVADAPIQSTSMFKLDWSPTSGKGSVIQTIPGDGTYRVCLGCEYPGYAGGLWVGSMRAPGFQWVPATPIPGFRALNLFCAQDETLVDAATGAEYEPGWSQNFGRGDDGVTLAYLGGEILEDGSAGGDVVLKSINSAGCYRETRYLRWPLGKPYLLVALHVTNTCAKQQAFDFWTGDDPWIGMYQTSEGDVGWQPGRIIREESLLDASNFQVAGFYDLGNDLTGEKPGTFSNVANFFALDPSSPKPHHASFANRFAHVADEVHEGRPLDNKSLMALNLGWKKVTLKSGDSWRLAYAMGRARTSEPGGVPVPPAIPPAQWRFDEAHYLAEGRSWAGDKVGTKSPAPLHFREETIHVSINPPNMTVDALYVFENRTDASMNMGIFYPLPLAPEHEFPHEVDVRGAGWRKVANGLQWRLAVGPRESSTVEVRYTQKSLGNLARYVLTSTSFWNRALEKGNYRVDWPASLPDVKVSYPGNAQERDGRMWLQWQESEFMPKKDIVVTW